MRPVSWGLVVSAALLAAAGPRPAYADDDTGKPSYHTVVDLIELEPASVGGQRLRVHVSSLSLQGQVVDLDPGSLKVIAGGSELKAPFAVGTYAPTNADTAIVVVVQVSVSYSEVLPVIADALDQNVLATANERTQVAILGYGENVGIDKLAGLKTARGRIPSILTDGSAGEPVLLDAIERALGLLRKAKTNPEGRPLRKMILVIGDGRDPSGDRERVTRIGKRADREGVRIHAFGYSPKDVRRPLLALGELSKRSFGTFRWIRSGRAESWTPAFQQLHAEIDKQLVLTLFLGAEEEVADKKLKIVTTGHPPVTSNELKIPALGCSGQTCEPGTYCAGDRCNTPKRPHGRGVFGWILVIGGILIAVIVALGFVGFLITRRQQAAAANPLQPGVPGVPVAPVPRPVKQRKPPKSAPPVSAPPAQPAVITGPRFYILSGPRTDQTLALRHGFLIGKAPNCDLVIDDGYTSGQHALIGMDHFGNCRVYDQGSTNGTFVNGVRITESVLEHGNTLRIGSTDLRFLAQ